MRVVPDDAVGAGINYLPGQVSLVGPWIVRELDSPVQRYEYDGVAVLVLLYIFFYLLQDQGCGSWLFRSGIEVFGRSFAVGQNAQIHGPEMKYSGPPRLVKVSSGSGILDSHVAETEDRIKHTFRAVVHDVVIGNGNDIELYIREACGEQWVQAEDIGLVAGWVVIGCNRRFQVGEYQVIFLHKGRDLVERVVSSLFFHGIIRPVCQKYVAREEKGKAFFGKKGHLLFQTGNPLIQDSDFPG